ncbi:MAG: tRNA (adenosine(37)-N6)-dimethylallyltransferase MiaA [Pseudomonadales bacterium]
MGPTAAGKTDLAMKLYDALPCELISVDSALIYKGMDIGTAKPTGDELARYPHHLVDIIDPAESYSAAQFRNDVLGLMADISARGKIPLLVGGTMLYYNALIKGLAPLPQADDDVRAKILAQAAAEGWPAMHAQLREVDATAAQRLAPNDSQRIGRALEVYYLTGKSLTEHWAEQEKQTLPYDVLNLAVMPAQRSVLHERIALRFDIMMEQGFLQEVEGLHARGDLDLSMPSVRCVGYRQVWNYLEGECDLATAREKSIVATRQLAKRQITWLRSWKDLHWLDPQSEDLLPKALKLLDSAAI